MKGRGTNEGEGKNVIFSSFENKMSISSVYITQGNLGSVQSNIIGKHIIFSIFYLYLFWKKIPFERKETISDMIKHNRCQSNPIFFNIPYLFIYIYIYIYIYIRIIDIDYASNSLYHTPTTMSIQSYRQYSIYTSFLIYLCIRIVDINFWIRFTSQYSNYYIYIYIYIYICTID
jgi:hypothetical protein